MAEGSRWSFRGSRGKPPPDTKLASVASRRDARSPLFWVNPGACFTTRKTHSQRFWHPFWVLSGCYVFARRTGGRPLFPCRPPATSFQPCRVGFQKRDHSQAVLFWSYGLDAALSPAKSRRRSCNTANNPQGRRNPESPRSQAPPNLPGELSQRLPRRRLACPHQPR